MRLRLAVVSAFAVSFALGSCQWSSVDPNVAYPCDNGTCDPGFRCDSSNHCVPEGGPGGGGGAAGGGSGGSGGSAGGGGTGGGSTCSPVAASAVCSDAGVTCGDITRPDGCGVVRSYTCGGCDGGICRAGACCALPSAAAACSDAGFACGSYEYRACGQQVVVQCPACPVASDTCQSDDTSAVCVPCVPETDNDFCFRTISTCGSKTANDNCGVARTVNCGTCDDGGCGGSSAGANLCECQSLLQTCAVGFQCCTGTCGNAGLCCVATGQFCADDPDCCSGNCTAGLCVPGDGGSNNGR